MIDFSSEAVSLTEILGLVFVYFGLSALQIAASTVITALSGGHLGGFMLSVLIAIWPLALAYWLLRGSPLIMRIAYPDAQDASKKETQVGGVFGDKV